MDLRKAEKAIKVLQDLKATVEKRNGTLGNRF